MQWTRCHSMVVSSPKFGFATFEKNTMHAICEVVLAMEPTSVRAAILKVRNAMRMGQHDNALMQIAVTLPRLRDSTAAKELTALRTK